MALPLGLIGVYLRTRLADTPAYLALEKEADQRERSRKTGNELRKIAALWPFLLVCMGLVLAWNVTNYMLTSYMPTYVTTTMPDCQGGSSVSETTSQILQIVVMAIALVTIPLLGRLSDRIGRKPIVWVGSIGLIVLSLPAVLLIRAQTGVTIFLGLLIMGVLLICFSATMPSTLPSLFPTALRGGGLSIAFNVSVSLFGGYDVRGRRRPGQRHRRPQLAGVLPDRHRGDRRRVDLVHPGVERPAPLGVAAGGRLRRGRPRAGLDPRRLTRGSRVGGDGPRLGRMSYPDPRYLGDTGEVSATLRRVDDPAELPTATGACHYLATGATTHGQFGLYRWEMGPQPSGPGPTSTARCRSRSSCSTARSGSTTAPGWVDAGPGDFIFVPEGGIHGFRNESGAPASMLSCSPRGRRGRRTSRGSRAARFARRSDAGGAGGVLRSHDNVWV